MPVVLKYPLSDQGVPRRGLILPIDFTPRAVAMQHGQPTLWGETSGAIDEVEPRRVSIVGTGHQIPPETPCFLGTCFDNAFVWHIYISPSITTTKGASHE